MSRTGVDLQALHWPVWTARTALRPIAPGDVDAVLAYRSRSDVAQYLNGGPLSRAEVADRIARQVGAISPQQQGHQGHEERQQPLLGLAIEVDGAVVGDAMVRLEPDDNDMWGAVLGYTIHPDLAGRGLATEVAGALVRLCFTELGVAMVTADVFVPHRASQRVLEKAGLRRVAEKAAGSDGDGRPRLDDYVYAVTAAEWAERQSTPGA